MQVARLNRLKHTFPLVVDRFRTIRCGEPILSIGVQFASRDDVRVGAEQQTWIDHQGLAVSIDLIQEQLIGRFQSVETQSSGRTFQVVGLLVTPSGTVEELSGSRTGTGRSIHQGGDDRLLQRMTPHAADHTGDLEEHPSRRFASSAASAT